VQDFLKVHLGNEIKDEAEFKRLVERCLKLLRTKPGEMGYQPDHKESLRQVKNMVQDFLVKKAYPL